MNVTIVGRGPSLLDHPASDYPDGPVICLNATIIHVRTLKLPNYIYTMQKDGCVPHGGGEDWFGPWPKCELVCGAGKARDTYYPIFPEHLLVSKAESPHCYEWYPRRTVIDVEAMELHWTMMSAPVATLWAIKELGADHLTMIGMDAMVHGDARAWEPYQDQGIIEGAYVAYLHAANEAARIAAREGVEITWVY